MKLRRMEEETVLEIENKEKWKLEDMEGMRGRRQWLGNGEVGTDSQKELGIEPSQSKRRWSQEG